MNGDNIRELLKREPFKPFEVRLTNGGVHVVKHPECVAMARASLVVVDPDTDRIAICALLHVASLSLIHPVGA